MMATFFAMNGAGGYVWSAYAVSALFLVATIALTFRAYNRAAAELRRVEGEDETSSK